MPKERHTLIKPSKVDIDEYKCGLRVRKGCIILRFHRIAGLISVGSSSEALTEPLNPWTDKPHSPYATPTKKTPTPLQSELCKCHYCKKSQIKWLQSIFTKPSSPEWGNQWFLSSLQGPSTAIILCWEVYCSRTFSARRSWVCERNRIAKKGV